MRTRRYHNYLYVIGYIMILRVVLNITVGISVFGTGMLFDLILMMFWVGIIAFFLKSIVSQKIYYIIVILICTIIVVGDSVYFDYFEVISARTSFAGLKWLQEGNTLEYDISIPLVAYLITPLLAGVIYLIITNKKKDVFFFKDFSIFSLVFLIQVTLFLIWGNRVFEERIDFYRSDAFLFETMHDRKLYSERYGYYNYHLLDLTRLRPQINKEEYYVEVEAYFDSLETHTTNDMSDVYAGYNVITILGETLETRFIDPVLTPNLYNMMTNGYSFDNYFTPVYQQGATCNSEYMSLTGLGSITTNDWSNNICDAYSGNYIPYSLPNQLKEIGYNTYYFHSGYEWFYNRKEMVPSYGFETVKFQEDLIPKYPDFYDRFDTEMLKFFDEYVNYDEPFYIDLLTYSGHGAYNQTEFDKYSDIVEAAHPGVELDPEIHNYMEKLVETDMMLGMIVDRLEENNQMDNTLFVIFPDHYPYMMNSETYSEYIDVGEEEHEFKRQTMFMYATNMESTVFHTPGSTIDITPTILNMINSNLEFDYFMGTDLFSDTPNFILFSDLTITDGENYLYLNERHTGNEIDIPYLEAALEQEITAFEIQKKLLNIDFFKMKKDRE